jgi:hypothetical protein
MLNGVRCATWVPVTVLMAGISVEALIVQQRIKPTAPGTPGDPNWQRVVALSDGRTFITDGGLAIDMAVVKPKPPAEGLAQVPGKVLESHLAGSFTNECGLSDLAVKEAGRTYVAPSGVLLNATYVDYLRRTLSASSVRLRMKGNAEPIVIVANGSAVGVLMPVKQ